MDMIDTDKYEGTWKIHGMEYWKHWYEGQCEADTNLIQDAPLLLAEVKRLRESIKAYLNLDMDSLEFCRIMREMGVIE
jgi:hypothetical protein